MTTKQDKLQKFDNDQLIDIIKNYRQYGYDDSLRENAISILEERGISKEQLQETELYENESYDYAKDVFKSFQRNSKMAFFIYLAFFVSKILLSFVAEEEYILLTIFGVLTIVLPILFIIFLVLSFINQNQFYKILGQNYGTEGVLLYVFLGMPFYIIMYFFFRNQMKEKMKEIK